MIELFFGRRHNKLTHNDSIRAFFQRLPDDRDCVEVALATRMSPKIEQRERRSRRLTRNRKACYRPKSRCPETAGGVASG